MKHCQHYRDEAGVCIYCNRDERGQVGYKRPARWRMRLINAYWRLRNL